MDHDNYSSGSLIGTVVIDMNTMIMRSDFSNSLGTFFDGWMPIYDTIEGIRGELNIVVSMEAKGDKNVSIKRSFLITSNLRKLLQVFSYLLVLQQIRKSFRYLVFLVLLKLLLLTMILNSSLKSVSDHHRKVMRRDRNNSITCRRVL